MMSSHMRSNFAALPPGQMRTRSVVRIDGRMGADGHIHWDSSVNSYGGGYPPQQRRYEQHTMQFQEQRPYGGYEQRTMQYQKLPPYDGYEQRTMQLQEQSPFYGSHNYQPSMTYPGQEHQPEVRPPLGYPLRERQASTGESIIMRQTERKLANRYHQLLLQQRMRHVHDPGSPQGPTMNMWPPPAPGFSYNMYQHNARPPQGYHHGGAPGPAPYAPAPAPNLYETQLPPQHKHDYGYDDYGHDDRGYGALAPAPAGFEGDDGYGDNPPFAASAPSPAPSPALRRAPLPAAHDPRMPTALSQFLRAFDGCTDAEDAEHAARRRDMFTRFDTNANGYISLAECGAGILLSLSRVAGRDATSLYHRYYRSYIRAFNDAKDAAVARAGHALDDDYVTKTEFRLLLRYLCVYATWYEVFSQLIDTGGKPKGGAAGASSRIDAIDAVRIEPDHRIVREEWDAALPAVREAGASWAPFLKLRDATAADFDEIDQNHGNYIDFREFAEWIEQAEKVAGTPAGLELGINETLDSPSAQPEHEARHAHKGQVAHVHHMRDGRRAAARW